MANQPKPRGMSLATIATRTYLDAARENRPLSLPIYQGTIYAAASAKSHAEIFQSRAPTFYQRFGHPNAIALGERVAALEGAESGLAFSSGMAAISTTFASLLDRKTHVVASEQIFDQTEKILRVFAAKFGVGVDLVDTTDLGKVKRAIKPATKAIYVETPSNPHLLISDIAGIANLARKTKIPMVVDNTFATPFGQQPIALGAALVVHSGTKLLNGHMDVMSGIVAGQERLIAPIRELQKLFGGVIDPHASWLAMRGIKTLGVRTERIFDTAIKVAEFLSNSPFVENVRYPLFEGDPQFALASRQMQGGGCVIAFSVKGGQQAARRLLDHLQLIHIASSLGGVETVIELPYDLDWSDKTKAKARKRDPLVELEQVRLSVGIEPAEEIIADLAQALSSLQGYWKDRALATGM